MARIRIFITSLENNVMSKRSSMISRYLVVCRQKSHFLIHSQMKVELIVARDWSQSHVYKIFKLLMDKPSLFVQKEMSLFCFSGDQDWRKLSVSSF